MSVTALLLRKCRDVRPALAYRQCPALADHHIFYYAARLIAGDYTN